MTTKLMLDEMFSPAIGFALNEAGYNVLCVAEKADLAGQPDEKIMATAAGQHRCLVTENIRDFQIIHNWYMATNLCHFGLIFSNSKRYPRNKNRANALVNALIDLIVTRNFSMENNIMWL